MMTAQVDKGSVNNIGSESDTFGEPQLLGLQKIEFDAIGTMSTSENRKRLSTYETTKQNVRLLGRTTSSICGLKGIKGYVTSAIHEPSGQMVAVKRYKLETKDEECSSCNSSQEKFNEDVMFILKEVIRMRQLRHPNIISILSSFVMDSEICLVLPLMKMGSTRDLLDSHFPEGLPENVITSILRDMLSALVHLHSKSIIHRSIRASHILLDPDQPMAKLAGFRYSCSLHDPPGQGLQERYDYPLHVATTNLNWMSPEILQQNLCGYNEKSDVYSLAVTACEMANGLIPFSEMPGTLMLLEKLRGAAPKLLDSSTVDIDDPGNLGDAANENGIGHMPSKMPEGEARTNQLSSLKAEPVGFSATQQPGDSGVGVSVGSCSNMVGAASNPNSQAGTMQALSSRASFYTSRVFSDAFHEFVADSSILEPAERPSAYELLNAHPFIRQFVKKYGGDKGKQKSGSILASLWSKVQVNKTTDSLKTDCVTAKGNDKLENTAHLNSKDNVDDIVEWEF